MMKQFVQKMDGTGRALDNVIIERFWRTLKYDEVYLNDYESPAQPERRMTRDAR